jgi:two-component system, cell cycle sensor histidine kinase PleC
LPVQGLSVIKVVLIATSAAFAVAAIFVSAQIGADPSTLRQLHWIFSAVAGGLVLCGFTLIGLLLWQNRLLTRTYDRLQALTEDLRDAKNEAEAASRAKSQFLANMSHELRTPLNAVIGFSQVIADELVGPINTAAYCEYARDILSSGQHMLELVNDILTMATLESGAYDASLTPLDLRYTVVRTVAIFRGAKAAQDRSITLTPNKPWPWIAADQRAIRQMLLNLLSNAAKFSEPQTPIEISCRISEDGEVFLTVADRGIGMTPDEVAEVVQPFQQAHSGLGRRYEGSGLGLSIVAGLIAHHGGRLAIDSEPGRGSAVSLVFPRAVPRPETASGTAAIAA